MNQTTPAPIFIPDPTDNQDRTALGSGSWSHVRAEGPPPYVEPSGRRHDIAADPTKIAAEVTDAASIEAAFAGMARARQAFTAEREDFARQLARKDKVHAAAQAELLAIVQRHLFEIDGFGEEAATRTLDHIKAELTEATRRAEIDAVLDEADVDLAPLDEALANLKAATDQEPSP